MRRRMNVEIQTTPEAAAKIREAFAAGKLEGLGVVAVEPVLKVGDRVKTKQLDPEKWARSSVGPLSNQTGVIEELREPNDNPITCATVLVRFDTPIERSQPGYPLPCKAHWFEPSEVEPLS